MKFGLTLIGSHPRENHPTENFANIIDHVRAARDSGWDFIWSGHHYLNEEYQRFQPVPEIARLAAEAGDMHVGTSFILPLHHPIIVAEQFATIDVITDGRAMIGPVAGYHQREFDAIGVAMDERFRRLREGIEVLKLLWTEDNVTYEGDHFNFEDVTITVEPVQKPRPPIWVGANSERGARRAGQMGDAYLGNAQVDTQTLGNQVRAAGQPSGEGFHGVQPARRDIFVAETTERALDVAGPYLAEYYDWYQEGGMGDSLDDSDQLEQGFDELRQDRFILGDPKTVAEELARLYTDIGIDCFLLAIHRPGIPSEEVVRSIELTGEEVIPRVRELVD